MRGRRCTKMLWQASDLSRDEAIARAEADPDCIALMWSTKASRAADGRDVGARGWYQGGGGTIGTLSNDDWDTILRPGFNETVAAAVRWNSCGYVQVGYTCAAASPAARSTPACGRRHSDGAFAAGQGLL
mmetsp:Transcript_36554/g.77978  ORF Transcript_36554/g.77978 Transcript_36554/m.77978 type:complete len:130 (-) Transcript_36554:625-1014(-)